MSDFDPVLSARLAGQHPVDGYLRRTHVREFTNFVVYKILVICGLQNNLVYHSI